jgi:protein ImuB
MKPAELYACLYAREFPAQSLLRLRTEARQQACAVLYGEPPLERVCATNARARRQGVTHGMTRVELDTVPGVTILARSSAEETSARGAVLECAGQFSPRIEDLPRDHELLCVLDIAGTEKLFGAPATLARKLLAGVRRLGVAACVAISTNFHAAVCLAQGMNAVNQALVVPPGEEARALATLLISVLSLSEAPAETFKHWGIDTLGTLAALPEAALISRLGQQGRQLRALARGEHPHLFRPVEPPFMLDERMELDSPVEVLESLLFVTGAMLEQLILRASTRALALASVTLTLALEGGTIHIRTVQPALPSIDRQLWIKLIHLDLEAHPPEAAVLALALTAEPGKTGKVQLGLFSPQTPEAARLDVTLARIRAIVGERHVGRAVLLDTHRTEAFRIEPFHVPPGQPSPAATSPSRTAMRQLRPAESIVVHLRDGQPEALFFRGARYTVEHAYGPWLASGNWWSGSRWMLRQWDVIARSGEEVLCGCIARTDSRWLMAGLYD